MRRIPEFIAEAKQLADFVIIDTAPLGAVSDALRVAGAVDDVVLVVRPGHTDRSEVRRARELLERLHHTPTGLVVVGQGRSGGGAGDYGYGVDVAPVADSAQTAAEAANRRRG
jgi:Mrp family chromosome partitioning ATPase